MSREDDRFPIHSEDRDLVPGCPFSFPWSELAKHEPQARSNHSQSLQRLAERGGLSLWEIFCAMHESDIFPAPTTSQKEAALRYVLGVVSARHLFKEEPK